MRGPVSNLPLRVAIVGLGPKGLYALERLLEQIAGCAARGPVEIDAFDPHPVPAAGPVYDPAQPGYLRMNFADEQVDIWPHGSRVVPPAEQLSFVDWRARAADLREREPYPPRAQVGRYLIDALDSLLGHAPAGVAISIRRAEVNSVRPSGSRWRVWAADLSREYDEVIVATGHARGWDGALANDWPHAAPLVGAVFPVEDLSSAGPAYPGSVVAVRGFALTFIDAALALTEGRGGRFEANDDPSGLRYRTAGSEPAMILPFSRTGEPMLAKPDPASAPCSETWTRTVADARARILALPPGFGIEAELVPVLAEVAAAQGSDRDPALDPVAQIQRSLAVATGRGEGDRGTALGAAWRAVYPALVERLSGNGVDPGQWPSFLALSHEMERLAFGPPALNAAKLLALINAGLVDLRHVAGARLETIRGQTVLRSAAGRTPIDCAVDAVLSPPGVIGIDSPLLAQLIAEGHVRVPAGRRGIEVTADATCVSAAGIPVIGLGACGRPTEDSVIGNDTLNRTLHPQLDRWAARVSARLSSRLSTRGYAGRR